MKQENIDMLCAKFDKSVHKSQRGELKIAIEKADDSKFDALNKMTVMCGPIIGFEGLIAILATILSAVLIVLNLLAFVFVIPKYDAYTNYAAKISDDMDKYYWRTAQCGNIVETIVDDTDSDADSVSTVPLFYSYENDAYNKLLNDYNESFNSLSKAEDKYKEAYAEYSANADYVANRVTNYLNYVVLLDGLEEPQQGEENYEDLKKNYDETKKTYEEKIAEYDKKKTGLSEEENNLNRLLESYYGYAVECAEKIVVVTDSIKALVLTDEYKAKIYADPILGIYGLTDFLKSCKVALDNQFANYKTAVNTYFDCVQTIGQHPDKLETDRARLQNVKTVWQSAKNDLEATFTEYVAEYMNYTALVKEYEAYVKDNAEKYKKVVAEQANEQTATEENRLWLEDYNAEVERYESEIAIYEDRILYAYDKVMSLLKIKAYTDLLINKAEIEAEIDEISSLIEQTESDKVSLETRIKELNKDLEECNKKIEKQKTNIAVYVEIMNGTVWTDAYYAAYLKENKEDKDFVLKKSVYETVANAEYAVGSGEAKSIISDIYSYNRAIHLQRFSEYDGAISYFAAEELTLRLQATVNALPKILAPVSDYYETVEDAEKLNWLNVNSDMRGKVNKDLALSEHSAKLDSFLGIVKPTGLDNLVFGVYDVTEKEVVDKVVEKIKKMIDEQSFNSIIKGFNELTDDMKLLRENAEQKTIDYQITSNVFRSFFLTIDIIFAVTLACYFIYAVCAGVSQSKRTNYEEIMKALKD